MAENIQTLMRGLDILRAFRSERKPLPNRAIANRTGLPKSTVSRLTTSLVDQGYLVRLADNGQFRLGTRILRIGDAYLHASGIEGAVRPLVEEFVTHHRVSLGLAVPDHLHMRYLVWCRNPQTITLRLGVGMALPIANTAIGRAYLWALPQTERRKLLLKITSGNDERRRAIATKIVTAFSDLERKGYCISVAEFRENYFGIGTPVVLNSGKTVISLGVGGATADVKAAKSRKDIGEDLLVLAHNIRDIVSRCGALNI